MKKIATALSVLLLTYSVVCLTTEKASPRAAAAEDSELSIPQHEITSGSGTVQPRTEGGKTRRLASKRNAKAKDAPPVRDTTEAELMRAMLPWAAGALTLIGLGMLVSCLVLRFRRLADVEIARSITQIRLTDAGWGKQRITQPRLASGLASMEPPSSEALFDGQEQEAEFAERRAA